MAKNLVIVESPAKAKTIKKFLGSNYEVIASNGHVRDLPKSQLGFDKENNVTIEYLISSTGFDKKTTLRTKSAKGCFEKMVPRLGIEPRTRGFSVPCSTY